MSPRDNALQWHIKSREELLHRSIFTVYAYHCVDVQGVEAQFSVIKSSAWVHTIAPIIDDQGRTCLVMVRQYRHGSESITLEFPGGVVAENEEPQSAGLRELLEETGYAAEHCTIIGTTNPNPAMMNNRVYTLLAHHVFKKGQPNPDANERLGIELVPQSEILNLSRPDFSDHALMLASLQWYQMQL